MDESTTDDDEATADVDRRASASATTMDATADASKCEASADGSLRETARRRVR